MKSAYIVASVVVAVVAFAGVTVAGVGPFGKVHQLIYNPDAAARAALRTGRDQSATTTDLTKIVRTENKPDYISKAISYAEVASTSQSGKIDEYLTVDNTLKSVSFCGKNFKTRQIMLNGVDIVQRIAQLASSDQLGKGVGDISIGQGICNSIPSNEVYTRGILITADVMKPEGDAQSVGGSYRVVYLAAQGFSINLTTNEIFMIEGFDGSLYGPIARLK